MTFKREQRYIVLKVKDVLACNFTQEQIDAFNVVCDAVNRYRIESGKGLLECVIVEKDWPNYEETWKEIERIEVLRGKEPT
jgi:hypothetical protein